MTGLLALLDSTARNAAVRAGQCTDEAGAARGPGSHGAVRRGKRTLHAHVELALCTDAAVAAEGSVVAGQMADAHAEGANEGAVKRLHRRRAAHLGSDGSKVAPRAQIGGERRVGSTSGEEADRLYRDAQAEGNGWQGGAKSKSIDPFDAAEVDVLRRRQRHILGQAATTRPGE